MMKLSEVQYEVKVDVPVDKAWPVLARYSDVGDFNSALISSHGLSPGKEQGVGAERFCQIDKKVQIKERIVRWQEGKEYTYDVYEWKNFPLNKMLNTFGVKQNGDGKTVIYQTSKYRLRPGILTSIMKGKLRKGMRDALLSYKHFMETGEKRPDVKALRVKYKNH